MKTDIVKYLIDNDYTNSDFGDYNIYFYKIYNKKLYVSIYYYSYKPDVINLSCLFPVSGIIDKSILSNFPYEEVQKQLAEIFGRCYVIRYIKETIQIIFYLDKEEEIIKWVDLFEKDWEEFRSLIFDLINDIGEKKW